MPSHISPDYAKALMNNAFRIFPQLRKAVNEFYKSCNQKFSLTLFEICFKQLLENVHQHRKCLFVLLQRIIKSQVGQTDIMQILNYILIVDVLMVKLFYKFLSAFVYAPV